MKQSKTKGAARLLSYLSPEMTAAELARKLRVTDQAVYNWTHGFGRPGIKHRRAIERLTGVPASVWLSAEELAEREPERAVGGN